MRHSMILILSLFVGVAVAACGDSPLESPLGGSALTPAGHSSVVTVNANPDDGWAFNPDLANFTPAGFSFDESVLGAGSLQVDPITNGLPSGPAAKFILAYTPASRVPVTDFDGFSIDFLIDGSAADADQFYVNVYTHTDPAHTNFYDCRFDYVAGSGSTAAWIPLALDGGTVATSVGDHLAGACPSTLDDMPGGSVVSFLAVNIGDTGTSDAGVGGYFDNAVWTVSGSATTFDFEPNCKGGGWESLTRPDGSSFKNQGQCVKYSKTGK